MCHVEDWHKMRRSPTALRFRLQMACLWRRDDDGWGGVNKKRAGRTLDGKTWEELPKKFSQGDSLPRSNDDRIPELQVLARIDGASHRHPSAPAECDATPLVASRRLTCQPL